MKKSQIVASLLLLLKAGVVLSNCTEYIEVPVPCNDPSHGSTCDGNHAGIHDDCGPGCDHGDAVIPCSTPAACATNIYNRENAAIDTAWGRCTDKNCIDKTTHTNAIRNAFATSAMNSWASNGMPLHPLTDPLTSNALTMTDLITNNKYNPCIGNEALTTAYNAAMARLDEIHPMGQ